MRTIETINKEYNLLDIEEVEEALSAFVGRKVSISNVDCLLTYFVSIDGEPSTTSMTLEFTSADDEEDLDYDDDECDGSFEAFSYEVFRDEEGRAHYWNGKRLSVDEHYLTPDMIFNFDVSAFHSFETETMEDYD